MVIKIFRYFFGAFLLAAGIGIMILVATSNAEIAMKIAAFSSGCFCLAVGVGVIAYPSSLLSVVMMLWP